MVSQWEAIAEAAVDDQRIRALAAACNMAHVGTTEFVAVLGAYCGRKALRMDFFDATFHEAPPMATDLPATTRAQEQRINELTAARCGAKVPNWRRLVCPDLRPSLRPTSMSWLVPRCDFNG